MIAIKPQRAQRSTKDTKKKTGNREWTRISANEKKREEIGKAFASIRAFLSLLCVLRALSGFVSFFPPTALTFFLLMRLNRPSEPNGQNNLVNEAAPQTWGIEPATLRGSLPEVLSQTVSDLAPPVEIRQSLCEGLQGRLPQVASLTVQFPPPKTLGCLLPEGRAILSPKRSFDLPLQPHHYGQNLEGEENRANAILAFVRRRILLSSRIGWRISCSRRSKR